MILLLDTSTPVCKISLIDGSRRKDNEWRADRDLAKGLLGYIQAQLKEFHKSLNDITAIGVYKGPGSFTGLRIGLSVLNTIADALGLPIVGASGETWQQVALSRLLGGENDKIVLPLYGRPANITSPRK